jgi:hypothetical protein
MPFIYNINKEQNLIQVKCSGNISLDELTKNMTKTNLDPNLTPAMNTLVDISNAVFDFNYEELDKLRDYIKATEQIHGKVKWAVVLKPDDTQYSAKLQMFQDINKVHGIDIQIRGFEKTQDALKWLQSEKE